MLPRPMNPISIQFLPHCSCALTLAQRRRQSARRKRSRHPAGTGPEFRAWQDPGWALADMISKLIISSHSMMHRAKNRDFLFLISDVGRLLRTYADQKARQLGMTRAQWA